MYRVLLFVAGLAACDPGVNSELTVRAAGASRDSVVLRAVDISRRLGIRYGLEVFNPSNDYCRLLLATGADQLRGQPLMLSLCIGDLDSANIRIIVGESITNAWGPRGDSLRHELSDTLAKVFGPAFNQR